MVARTVLDEPRVGVRLVPEIIKRAPRQLLPQALCVHQYALEYRLRQALLLAASTGFGVVRAVRDLQEQAPCSLCSRRLILGRNPKNMVAYYWVRGSTGCNRKS